MVDEASALIWYSISYVHCRGLDSYPVYTRYIFALDIRLFCNYCDIHNTSTPHCSPHYSLCNNAGITYMTSMSDGWYYAPCRSGAEGQLAALPKLYYSITALLITQRLVNVIDLPFALITLDFDVNSLKLDSLIASLWGQKKPSRGNQIESHKVFCPID